MMYCCSFDYVLMGGCWLFADFRLTEEGSGHVQSCGQHQGKEPCDTACMYSWCSMLAFTNDNQLKE